MGVEELFVDSPGPGIAAEDRPYRKLALEVICAAVTDFGGWPWRTAGSVAQARVVTGNPTSLEYRLRWFRFAIEAGRFLVERDDEVVQFWFAAAGISAHHARKHQPWIRRLAALRAQETELRRKVTLNATWKRRGDGRYRAVGA